jgi:hypothetical protein
MKLIIILILALSQLAQSQQKYNLYCNQDLIVESRKIILTQENVLEYGSNSGPVIKDYLASVGLAEGFPYCAAGQYWCWLIACNNLKSNLSEIPLPRSGLAVTTFSHSHKYGLRQKYIPEPDDLIIWRKAKSSFGHVERIVRKLGYGWVETIGFNTRKMINGKLHEGVFRQKRNIYSHLGRLRILGLVGFIARSSHGS